MGSLANCTKLLQNPACCYSTPAAGYVGFDDIIWSTPDGVLVGGGYGIGEMYGGELMEKTGPTYVPVPKNIQAFAKARGMMAYQLNSQRFFGPSFHIYPGWKPEQGSEIFVGRLPRHAHEPQLLPFLEQVGPVYRLRLMMDFSGTNKGFCFVQYYHPNQADLAVAILHGTQIKKGYTVVCSRSVDNRRLLLGGVPTFVTEEQIYNELLKVSEGLVFVQATWSPPVFQPKGLVYLTYESHRVAALARKRMLSGSLRFWGYQITVDWAEPDSNVLTPQVLRVANIPAETLTKTVKDIFNQESYNGIKRLKRYKTQTFIFFHSRGQAELAKVSLNGAMMGGVRIKVDWVDPNFVPLGMSERQRLKMRNRRRRQLQQQQTLKQTQTQKQTTTVLSTTSTTTTAVINRSLMNISIY